MWEAIREELQSVDQQIGDSLARLIGTLPALLVAILVVAVFVLIARLARRLLAGVSRVSRLDPMLRGLFDQLLTAAIVVFGVAVGLGVLGIDARTIIASFGVAGLIVGFALKDLLENFISGILILWRRPFRVLDHIQVGASEGIVEEITFRTTSLRTPDGVLVLVPNAQILTQAVRNYTYLGARRTEIVLSLPPEVDPEKARAALEETARGVPGVRQEPPPETLLLGLASEGYDLHLRYWTAPDQETVQRVESAVRRAAFATLARLREPAKSAAHADGSTDASQ